MKTRANSFFRSLVMGLIVSTLMVSCGKENKSGSKNSSSGGTTTTVTTYTNVNGTLPSNWLNILINEYPCPAATTGGTTNNARTVINVQNTYTGSLGINANTLYVGVSVEGDILVMQNVNNRTTVQVHACRRPNMVSTASFWSQPVMNYSQSCTMSEVTAADVTIESNIGYPYYLKFFPAGLSAPSSLCTQNSSYNNNIYYY